MNLNQLLMFDRYAWSYLPSGGRILEIGPEKSPSCFEERVPGGEQPWESAELRAALDENGERKWGPTEGTTATHWLDDEYVIPAESDTFDVVFSANVAEHVRQVWTWMKELARVTRPGGVVITIAPVSWPYHASPYDCWRIYPDGARVLADYAGLEVVLAVTERLEWTPSKRPFPGEGRICDHPFSRKRRLFGALGWPMAVSEDLISIARKPA